MAAVPSPILYHLTPPSGSLISRSALVSNCRLPTSVEVALKIHYIHLCILLAWSSALLNSRHPPDCKNDSRRFLYLGQTAARNHVSGRETSWDSSYIHSSCDLSLTFYAETLSFSIWVRTMCLSVTVLEALKYRTTSALRFILLLIELILIQTVIQYNMAWRLFNWTMATQVSLSCLQDIMHHC